MSKQNQAVLLAYERGYRVTKEGDFISPSGYKPKLYVGTGRRGYYLYNVKDVGSRVSLSFKVHRLAAYQKFGDKIFESGIQVRHLDNNKLNNSWDNLDVGTQSENIADMSEEMILKRNEASSRKLRKLTDEQVRNLRKDRLDGLTYKDLCNKYRLTNRAVFLAANYKTYRDVL